MLVSVSSTLWGLIVSNSENIMYGASYNSDNVAVLDFHFYHLFLNMGI